MKFSLIKRFIKASPKKQINALGLYLSYFLRLSRFPFRPIKLMIEPANFCNLACPTCPVGAGEIAKAKGTMSLDNFKKIIDEVGQYLYQITLWNWGEPFLNKDLAAMVKYARQKNIFVITSTNGHFLNDKNCSDLIDAGLNELIIALDGLSQETLTQYRRGANINQIIQGVKNLSDLKKARRSLYPQIQLQFIVMKHNEHELPKLKSFAAELGVDKISIKTFGSHLDKSRLKEFEPENKELSRYSRAAKAKNSCLNIWLGMNINYDGTVVPCCYDPFEKYNLGNVFSSGVTSVWFGKNLANFRQKLLKNKQAISICANCDFNKNINTIINLNKHDEG